MERQCTVLIAAGAGPLKDALRAMLVSMLHVNICEAESAAEAEALLREHGFRLVIIDSGLPGNHTMQLVLAVQRARPRVACAILVDNVMEQAAALRAGADCALLKGEPPARLFAQVEQLLWPSELYPATT